MVTANESCYLCHAITTKKHVQACGDANLAFRITCTNLKSNAEIGIQVGDSHD
eukprot:CAMPEP_0169270704 /NCGR_PEP_ID=MMETSP1016-20121227/49284_1 /TAXON_ID=342587 /ORGANISM="Karlodinium micrum, Strain CCMP2283" /LENGTH=52 /DNA_ID=CAMNT_0009356117 /DNA_START=205 /DNA_END=360 /DNA_ORIENTATION=+